MAMTASGLKAKVEDKMGELDLETLDKDSLLTAICEALVEYIQKLFKINTILIDYLVWGEGPLDIHSQPIHCKLQSAAWQKAWGQNGLGNSTAESHHEESE